MGDVFWISLTIFFSILFINFAFAGNPESPDGLDILANETYVNLNSSGTMVNISGGYLATLNLTTSFQDYRWKALVGYVSGEFTLDDESGSTVYDWALASISGKVYATRNSSGLSWVQIACANTTILENENFLMNHTSASDNITATFSRKNHSSFSVGEKTIDENDCPSLNTYVNNASQTEIFIEVALYDGINETTGGNIVYTTILEQNTEGYDGQEYDFQMIVPEIGLSTFSSRTAYYLYVEII
jgi:hypothetical protein